MRIRVLSLLVLLACAAPAAADPVATGGATLQRDLTAVTNPNAHRASVDAFEGSATAATLRFQHRLADDVELRNAPWLGTHNSFNSIAEMGPALSALDANQRLSLRDQLRIGVRSLELDLHQWLGRPVVCHAQSRHEGCTTERILYDLLKEPADWIRAHPGEVVLLYFENKLDGWAGESEAADVLRARLGKLLYTPRGTGCTELPLDLTRADVLAAGAQVVVVTGDCGTSAWQGVAHAWDRHVEGQPDDFHVDTCADEGYERTLVRFYEDSTFVSSAVDPTAPADPLTPWHVTEMLRCGVDLLGLDQVLPGDGRPEAAAWSWADGPPADGGRCAVLGERWTAAGCGAERPAACRAADGAWSTTAPVRAEDALAACARRGAQFAVPRTAHENALLRAAAGDRKVLLGLERRRAGWTALDRR